MWKKLGTQARSQHGLADVSPLVTPLIHPASILRGRHHLEPAQIAYLKRLASDPLAIPLNVSISPPLCNPNPTLEQLREFVETAKLHKMVSFDVENAGPRLICCGMVAVSSFDLSPQEGVCFRFLRQGGSSWWPLESVAEVHKLLRGILGDTDITKVGHFIVQHDIPLLETLGFKVRGRLIDTSVLLHATHSELPKGLQFAATLFCGAPRWKDIPDEKEVTEAPEVEGDE